MISLFITGFFVGWAYGDFRVKESQLSFEFKDSENVLTEEEKQQVIKTLNTEWEEKDLKKEEQSKSEAESPLGEAPFVGSAKSDKFYSVDCSYAKRIKEENKVWFNSKEEGEQEGRKFIDC